LQNVSGNIIWTTVHICLTADMNEVQYDARPKDSKPPTLRCRM